MSRAYRIAVTEQLRRHIQVDDGVSSKIEVLPILPTERMGELLGAQLEERGFKRENGKALRQEAGGDEVSIDLKTGALDVTAKASKEVDIATERAGVITNKEQEQATTEQLRSAARADLEERAAASK